MRDYRAWHTAYDDPRSSLSWRLRTVQRLIGEALDRVDGEVRVLSVCAGDGRDVLGVLASREDAARVAVTLVEIDPVLSGRARDLAGATTARVEVRTCDAGTTAAYVGAVPADLVLLVGVFGNIADADVERTVAAAPQLCAPGASLIWSRGRSLTLESTDLAGDAGIERITGWFAQAGFESISTDTLEEGSRPVLSVVRHRGRPQPLEPRTPLFTFVR